MNIKLLFIAMEKPRFFTWFLITRHDFACTQTHYELVMRRSDQRRVQPKSMVFIWNNALWSNNNDQNPEFRGRDSYNNDQNPAFRGRDSDK